MPRKLVLFGLDGGSLDIIKKMVDRGELPTFQKVMDNGVYGELESTIPPVTCPAWQSMFTGLNPGKFDSADFFRPNKNYEQESGKPDCRGRFFWDFLGKEGFKCGIMKRGGVVYKINGFMMSGFRASDKMYPKNLQVDRNEKPLYKVSRPSKKIELLFENIKKKEKSLSQLLEQDWDLLTYVVKETDHISHYSSEWSDVRKVYREMDRHLSKILDETDDCNVIIASDHGIKRIQKRIYINNLLEKIDLLTRKKRNYFRKLIVKTANFLRRKFGKSILQSLISMLPIGSSEQIKSSSLGMIQKEKTKMFAYGMRTGSYPRLWINSEDRFKKGPVKKSQIDSLKKEFYEKVSKMNENEKLIDEIFEGSEVYGKESRNLPDLIVKLPDDSIEDYTLASEVSADENDFAHDLQGVFMAYGPDIESSGKELRDLRIYDIASTILHAFGVPVSESVDGRVLKEIFREKSEPFEEEVKYQKAEGKKQVKEKVGRLKSRGKI